MSQAATECEELRISLERLRALLDGLVVRGLRACGPEQIAQLAAFAEQLDQAGAGHIAAILTDLRTHIEQDNRAVARVLLKAQTAVRLLERLLTLRVVRGHYELALAALDRADDAEVSDDQAETEEA